MMALWPSRSRQVMTGRATRMLRYTLYAALVVGVGALIHHGAGLALFASSHDAPRHAPSLVASPRLPGGALVICGGGNTPVSVRDRFIELAGGASAKIVIIPTAHTYADTPNVSSALDAWKDHSLASIQLLHTRSRVQADDPEFVRPLIEATGVWFGGGKQEKLAEVYLGTEVERQLMALLARGGVIGGTSAGAAIMSRLMIVSGRTEAKLEQGFDFLPGVVIDQHFLKRNRLQRLLGVVRTHPDLIGLGIDEATALVVDIRNKRVQVIGNSYVVATTSSTTSTEVTAILKPGDQADLAALRAHSGNAIVESIDFEAL